ncbi:trafficking kinesin-binding protein 1-like isoform X2 [Homarus americanus]|uniref:trafficking kinesin-binding protein 1-like isoform X2 n=1 Tax=Homarus americanus TaxID=6706 RepID=UPI001C463A7B|nr:trafficking kinesin-binding protein 1-like isoform X2 [Homarus americanus]
MDSAAVIATPLGSVPPRSHPACEEVKYEFQCYTDERPDFSPVKDVGNYRERIKPFRRASSGGRRCLGFDRGQHVDGHALKVASKIMMLKNQVWLSQEDLTLREPQDVYASAVPDGASPLGARMRMGDILTNSSVPKCPWSGTISDEASATMTRFSSLEALNDSSPIPIIQSTVFKSSENISSPSPPITQEFSAKKKVRTISHSNSTSSSTLTPSSDATLSPGESVEVLGAPSVTNSPAARSISPNPSFTLCRGDSVDGLFISSSSPTPESSLEPLHVVSSPTDSHQSPFRRQLFQSLMTRQSALVARVSRQSCRLLETMQVVASLDSTAHETQVQATSSQPPNVSAKSQQEDVTQTSLFNVGVSEETNSELSKTLSNFQWEETSSLTLGEEQEFSSTGRLSERLVSICDSGVGWDTDDERRSLSRGSSSAFTEDSDGTVEDDQVLCGNRVSQMTKTYNDIDAVTRLLQEKEKDLELAAKIGQQLLNRNKVLEERNAILDAEVSAASDKITQLKHDLQMKTDLLQIYTNDVDDTSSCETTPTGLRVINVDILQHRVRNLEDENRTLRQEASQLATDTLECEDKEKELVTDVIKQLSDANLQVGQLSEELARKVEDSLRQQEEITHLLAQVVDLQSRSKRLMVENDELANMVGVARDCQQELTMELAELKEKYAEVLDLLHDTQDQLRRVQRKNVPGSRGHHLGSSLFSSPFNSGGNDSIASELHSLNSMGDETGKGPSSMRRTFDTVRLTGKYVGSGSQGSLSSLGYGGSLHSTPTRHLHTPSHMATPTHMASSGGTYAMSYMGSQGSSVYSGGSGHPSLDSGADSDASMHTDSEDNYPGSHLGVPGWPGTPDLDSCLRRLGPGNRSGTPSQFLPYGCRTPDSIMSTGSGKSGLSNFGSNNASDWRLPQKLQIVKPIEGSLTLHQWSRLATPHLGGLLEEREGVAIKGGAGAEQLNLDVYSMSDLEEDEVEEENPGKRFMSTSGVFTYTNSTILHPDDQTNLTPSLRQTQVSVMPTSSTSVVPTPSTPMRAPSCPPSRRGSTATFSTNTGLAKVLNERGMNITSRFSPTATPANSPTNSRPGSPEPEGYKLPGLEDLTKTFHYGASLLRRTFYKDDPSAPQSPAGPRVNLVEQVQAIGVDRFVGSSDRALTVGGIVMSRPATSPLLHLSNLIMSSAKTSTISSTTSSTTTTTTYSSADAGAIMSTPKIPSPGERRPTLPSGALMGIPGHPGSGHLDNRLSQLKPGQRADLGTVSGRPRPTSLGSAPPPRGSGVEQNVGTVGWTSFGRKGGLL